MRRNTDLDLMRKGLEIFLRGVAGASAGASGRRSGRGASLAGVSGRVAKAWHDDLLSGYRQEPAEILKALTARSSEDLVALRDIEFTSICRHHLLPFHGRVHLAYAPAGRITGLSRLGRLVDCLSRRLQLQESLTRQIVDAIQEHLHPEGAACVVEASHTCMSARGGRKTAVRIVTAAFSGRFRNSGAQRREVLGVLGFGSPQRLRGRHR